MLSFGDGETINIGGTFTAKTNVGDFDYGSTLTAGTDLTSSKKSVPSYSLDNFARVADDISYRMGKNYFEVKFVPSWLEREFMSIDFDYSFDNFGIKNAIEDELIID